MIRLTGKEKYSVGVLSDTHGMLRNVVYETFRDVDLIVHAGDVGGTEVLRVLKEMAPVVAVKGNTDGHWASEALPSTEMVSIGNIMLYVLHDLMHLDLDPAVAGVSGVISGHTHQPHLETKSGVLYLNPGSVGPRRFDYPISVARLDIEGRNLSPRILTFDP